MIYLDSCALLKLVITEPETVVLTAHLDAAGETKISTEFALVEVRRALIRLEAQADRHRAADDLLTEVARLPIGPILNDAARLPEQHLRSADAIHLATARSLGSAVTQFITYDKRLAQFASDAGMPVVMPGVD